ncbi:MAG: outer membrane protein transport protein [Candidatus Aminicenantes bacterium]|nr:MAG: outer membrane protein transport protein [Candidatus Aminicenantes bacterium]
MRKKSLILLVSVILSTANLWAGGWNNTLIGCRALAIGGAFVAVADDPSAIFHNPAGLVYQESRINLSIDGFYISPVHEYVTTGGDRVESRYKSSLPQFFLTYRANSRLTFGFGFYVPYAGGGYDWKESVQVQPFKSTMGVYSLTPAVSYKFSEKLSLGFNLNFYNSVLDIDMEDATFGPMKSEEKGSAVSAGFGLRFRPSQRLSIGLGVSGPAKLTLTGRTEVTLTDPLLGTFSILLDSETSFDLPWDIELGVAYRLTENLLLSISAQRTMWSALDKVEKVMKDVPGIGDIEETQIMDYEDITILRVGFEYFVSGGIILRGGLGYDRCACPEDTLDYKGNIDVDKFTLIGGIGYRTGRTQIDFVYAYAAGEERVKPITGFPSPERYNLSAAIMGVGITFSF